MSTPIDPDTWREGSVRALLTGKGEAQLAVDAVIQRAQNSLALFDLTLKDRGFNSPARVEALRRFLLAHRSHTLRIAMHDPESLVRDCPRLVVLAQQFSSVIQVHRTLGVARAAKDPLLLADDAHFWHHLHHEHPRSVLSLGNAAEAAPLLERFEDIWALSEPVSPGSAIGL